MRPGEDSAPAGRAHDQVNCTAQPTGGAELPRAERSGSRLAMSSPDLSEMPTARIAVLVLGGTLVCSAVVVMVPIATVHSAWIGDVHQASDVAMEVVFFVLAAALLAVVARAWR